VPTEEALELFKKGKDEFEAKNYDLSLSYFQQSIDLNPENHKTHTNLANVLLKLRRFEEALEAADESLELSKSSGGYYVRGRAYMDLQM
jgi:tetratricopeptide (TPR) repeat protein